jgi:16S rRNA (adenine1518-N6/adenine1519-N6)-dimethyltransferase
MAGNGTKELMKKYAVRPVKSLGQNFLTDDGIIDNIISYAGISESDIVIEIGPGVGSMTAKLAEKAGFVAAIEIDRHLIPVLESRLSGYSNIFILNEDVLKLDIKTQVIDVAKKISSLNGPIKVVSNLPYYITTPIIMKMLEDDPGISLMIFMVQKEVAARMAAKPGNKDYGALSVAVQYYCHPDIVMSVPPHCFIPQPEVDSSVVRLDVYTRPPLMPNDKSVFFKVVKAAFGQRRKTLVNALFNSNNFIKSKEEIKDTLKSMGIDENERGENLSILQFVELSNSFLLKDC